jgi:pimeloyl-ACP methyl ester carboxylesterase
MASRHDSAVLLGELDEPPGDFVLAAGLRVHYVMHGEGRPVIYIHGAKGSVYDLLLSIGDRLARRWTAVAFDRPGSGFSGRSAQDGGSPQAQAAVLRAAAAELGLERPVLVGHSFGAAVALAWALDAPDEVAAVVTLGGYVLPLGGPPPWVVALLRSRTTLRAMSRLGRSRLGRPFVDSALRRAFFPGRPPHDYVRIAPAMALGEARFMNDGDDRKSAEAGLRALQPRYATLGTPVVVVVGVHDRMVPPSTSEKLHQLLPRAEIVRLTASGHMPQFTEPDAVLAAVDRAADLGESTFASLAAPAYHPRRSR